MLVTIGRTVHSGWDLYYKYVLWLKKASLLPRDSLFIHLIIYICQQQKQFVSEELMYNFCCKNAALVSTRRLFQKLKQPVATTVNDFIQTYAPKKHCRQQD